MRISAETLKIVYEAVDNFEGNGLTVEYVKIDEQTIQITFEESICEED